MINIQNIAVKANSSFQTVCPFPVGYIYQSTNSTSPANIFGGSWTALTDGRFMKYSGSWNNTGGASSHSHSTDDMRALIGAVDSDRSAIGYHAISNLPGEYYNIKVQASSGFSGTWGLSTEASINHTTKVLGTVNFQSNLPPYRTCYAWYRTA